MSNWIYLKSSSPEDALALSAVISNSDRHYNVVRQSCFTSLLYGHPNIDIYGIPLESDDVKILSINSNNTFEEKCQSLSEQLSVTGSDYVPFIPKRDELGGIKSLIDNSNVLIVLEHPKEDLLVDVLLIDKIVHGLSEKGYKSIQTSDFTLPHIRGTYDLRGSDALQLLLHIDSLKCIVSNSPFWQLIAKFMNKVFYKTDDIYNSLPENRDDINANIAINIISKSLQHG